MLDLTIALRSDLLHLEANGYTLTVIEKAAPPLPTEPGWYESEWFPVGTAADYDPYSLTTSGKWLAADGSKLTPEDMRKQGKLRRLEPVPVTAKRVLDAVIAQTIMHCNACSEQLAQIAAEFGVTE